MKARKHTWEQRLRSSGSAAVYAGADYCCENKLRCLEIYQTSAIFAAIWLTVKCI